MANNPYEDEPVDEYADEPAEVPVDEKGTRPFSLFGARSASAFASNPDEAVVFLNEKYGKGSKDPSLKSIEFDKHGKLDRLIWRNTANKDDSGWHYVDPNTPVAGLGLDEPYFGVGTAAKELAADAGEMLSDVMPVGLGALGAIGGAAMTAPSAAVSGPVGPSAGAVVGAGLGSGAGEAGNRGVARLLGVNKELDTEDLKDVGISTALGAGAEFGAPYIARGAKAVARSMPKAAEIIPVVGKAIKGAKHEAYLEKELFDDVYHNSATTIPLYEVDPLRKPELEDRLKDLYLRAMKNPKVIDKEGQALLDEYGITSATSKSVRDDFNELKDSFSKSLVALKELKKPPSELTENVTANLGLPQADELRAKNIKHVVDTLDNLEESIAPKQELPGMPMIPAKGATREELEKGLLDTFNDEYENVQNEIFGEAFDVISQQTAQIPFGPQSKQSLANTLNSIKVVSPEAKEAINEIKNLTQNAVNVKELFDLKRNELKTYFKSSDPNVQRELTQVYKAFNKGIEDAVPNMPGTNLKDFIKQTNSDYHDFMTNYGKIADSIRKGATKAGTQASQVFDKATVKYLENLTEGKDIDKFFGGTITTYQRVLLKKMREKLLKEGYSTDSFAKDLQNIARDPKQYAYFREMFGQTLGADPELVNFGQGMGNAITLKNIMKTAQTEGSSRYFVPPVQKRMPLSLPGSEKANMLADILRGTGKLTGITPYVGEAVYKPANFVQREVAQNLRNKLRGDK